MHPFTSKEEKEGLHIYANMETIHHFVKGYKESKDFVALLDRTLKEEVNDMKHRAY